jgi:hypothetical protein
VYLISILKGLTVEKWYKLDNAAKLYPSVSNYNRSAVFRVSAVLYESVNPVILQQALDHISEKYAFLFVRIHRGFFWNYFDTNHKKLLVQSELHYPCRDINRVENSGFMLRVLYYNKRVSVEIFHALADGGGTLEFIKSLLYYYFTFLGHYIENDGSVIGAEGKAETEYSDDSFARYYDPLKKERKQKGFLEKQKNAYRIRGTVYPQGGTSVISGLVSASALNTAAKKYNTTITGFLTALMIHSMFETHVKFDRSRAPVTIAVPVNLRKIFPSKTLRNFFSVINCPLHYDQRLSFNDICDHVTKVLKDKITKEYLQKQIYRTSKFTMHKVLRFAPLIIKKLFIQAGYSIMSETKKTLTLSNLGVIRIPPQMYDYMSHLEVLSYCSVRSPATCTISTLGDKMCISFTKTIEENDCIAFFFKFLAQNEGLDVRVYSNDWGDNYEVH